MGSHGGSAPNGFPQRQASTLYLRVPVDDWPLVKVGVRSEFRTMPKDGIRVTRANVPTPVVAYCTRGVRKETEARTMMLIDRRVEPLFALAEDEAALRRAGFETYHAFRKDWKARHKGIYRPMTLVHVWRLEAIEGNERIAADLIFGHLYGDWLP